MHSNRPVTLITGAGTGIGRATAEILSQQGHRVALVGRRAHVLREAGAALGREGEDWISISADIENPAQTLALPSRVTDALGRLDALVNNAGWTPLKPVAEHSPQDVSRIFAVNATGPILLLIAALGVMHKQGTGRIINVSSMASDDPFPGLSVYGAAKASLNIVTRGLAGELGPESKIKVFAVAPGAVETPLLRSLISEDVLPTEQYLTPESVGSLIADCVLGRRDAETGRTLWMPSQ